MLKLNLSILIVIVFITSITLTSAIPFAYDYLDHGGTGGGDNISNYYNVTNITNVTYAGNPFDQSLNTTDNVNFSSVTAPTISDGTATLTTGYLSGLFGIIKGGVLLIDTLNRLLIDSLGINALDWDNRTLYNESGDKVADWKDNFNITKDVCLDNSCISSWSDVNYTGSSSGFTNLTNFTEQLDNDKLCFYNSATDKLNCSYTDQTGGGDVNGTAINVTAIELNGTSIEDWDDLNQSVKYGCVIYRSSAQSIPSGSFTQVQLDGIAASVGDGCDTTNNLYTIQKTGWYTVVANQHYNAGTGGLQGIQIRANAAAMVYLMQENAGGNYVGRNAATIQYFTQGQNITMWTYQLAGVNRNIGTGNGYTYMSIVYEGESI